MRTRLLIAAVAMLGLAGGAYAAGDVAAGQQKAAGCAGCHGPNGEGSGSNPALAGKPQDQLEKAMKDYKSGARKNSVMKAMVSKLTPQDMENLAAYYASLKK
jgi:cytochrome c553